MHAKERGGSVSLLLGVCHFWGYGFAFDIGDTGHWIFKSIWIKKYQEGVTVSLDRDLDAVGISLLLPAEYDVVL